MPGNFSLSPSDCYIISKATLHNIADAIRRKTSTEREYSPGEMVSAIDSINAVENSNITLITKNISENGTYYPENDSVYGYSPVIVNVPNTFSSSDNGKVVSNGNLISQTSRACFSNGTYDTTFNNSITINVTSIFSNEDNGKVVSNGGLISQTSSIFTQNGTYDTTFNNSITISVASGGNENSLEDAIITRTISGLYENSRISQVGFNAFCNCISLQSINLPNCSRIESYAFDNCVSLQSISLPNCFYVEDGAFEACYLLQSVDLPNCSYIENYAFYICSSLQSVNLPNCSFVGYSAFYWCSSLQFVNLPNCSWIGDYAFGECSSLSKIILGYSSIVSIFTSHIFNNTPMSVSSYLGYYGSIYVPTSLVSIYKTSRYWSYYKDRIVGYGEEEEFEIKVDEDNYLIADGSIENDYFISNGEIINDYLVYNTEQTNNVKIDNDNFLVLNGSVNNDNFLVYNNTTNTDNYLVF